MQYKGLKISLIVLLSIAAIGIISLMIWLMFHKDKNFHIVFFNTKTEQIFQKEYALEEFEKLNIDALSSKVTIREGHSDKMKVTAYGKKHQLITEQLEDGTLSLTKENNVIGIFFCWYQEEIIIEIPKTIEKTIHVKTASGNISILDLEQSILQLESISGNITCGHMRTGNIQTTSGNIQCGNAQEAEIKSTSGKIQAKDLNQATIKTTSGNIQVNTLQNGSAESFSGRIHIQQTQTIQLKTLSGEISVGQIDGSCQIHSTSGNLKIDTCHLHANSHMKTTSGKIEVLHLEDVYVETKTTSGNTHINGNNRKSEIELTLETVSGNIKVNP